MVLKIGTRRKRGACGQLGKGDSSEDPEVGARLVCLKNSKEAREAEQKEKEKDW